MAGNIIHKDALVACDHTPGIATANAPSPRVQVSGMPVITILSPYTITGCNLQGTTSPACASGMWTEGATKVFVGGFPVAIDTGKSLCVASMGRLNARTVQKRVQAS